MNLNRSSIQIFLLGCCLLGLSGCQSIFLALLPNEFDPVTKERCEKLDMKALGKSDALIGHRDGDRYDFWKKDCAAFGVSLDRQVYGEGFQEGLQIYCSCVEGYKSGARGEFEELRGQYQACGKVLYQNFLRGREIARNEWGSVKDSERELKLKALSEEAFQQQASQSCQSSAPNLQTY